MADWWVFREFSSFDEFAILATSLFGPDWLRWPFVCPSCETVSTGADFELLGVDPQMALKECVGRHLGGLEGEPERGCTWTSYGLFSGPWFIQSADGTTGIFPLAAPSSDPAYGDVDS